MITTSSKTGNINELSSRPTLGRFILDLHKLFCAEDGPPISLCFWSEQGPCQRVWTVHMSRVIENVAINPVRITHSLFTFCLMPYFGYAADETRKSLSV
jgi:hypothetical protein